MNILAIDQARNGAWCVYDYALKAPIAYGVFSFPTEQFTYAQAMVGICDVVKDLMDRYSISAVFIEDIQLRKNADSFKKLAQLQGALVSMFERNEYLYDFVPPSKWQSYCNARGRTTKEVKSKLTKLATDKKQSKVLSIQFVKEQFGIVTEDDNLADAICIGYFVSTNIDIETVEEKEK
nr:MAG TPA: Lactococcus phage M3 protein [Caudoviricetes sp.]